MAHERPLKPDLSNPHHAVFMNFGRMILTGEYTAETANQYLDELGVKPNFRFWGAHNVVDPQSGRMNMYYYMWKDGGWVDGTEHRRLEIMEGINLKPRATENKK